MTSPEYARIGPGVQHVGEQIPDDRQHRQKQGKPHQYRIVAGGQRVDMNVARPRPVEYLFGNDRPGEQPRQLRSPAG